MNPSVALGPLDRWVDDDDVVEVMVNAGGEVWVERRGEGGTQYVGTIQPGVADAVVERLLAPTGRRVDRTTPVVDARLPDGSRLCAVVAPVAVDGTCLAIRKFAVRPFPLEAFAPPAVVEVLRDAVARRCNVLVSGATSSGKTSLLNALAATADVGERVITLEDTAELRLDAPHVLRLEARPPVPHGPPPVTLAGLLHAALRLRPDRLVVGEVRGEEALHLVQALNTGHDGSLCTLHANNPAEALTRLESLVVQAGPGWPLAAVHEQVRRCVDVVVHVARDPAGRRAVEEVAEVEPPGAGPTLRTVASAAGVVGRLARRRR